MATPNRSREAAITRRVGESRLARTAFAAPPTDATGGRDDYAGAFDPAFRLEHLSRAALVDVCREFLVQDHLLIRSLMIAVAERAGDAVAHEIATKQWIGAGAVAAAPAAPGPGEPRRRRRSDRRRPPPAPGVRAGLRAASGSPSRASARGSGSRTARLCAKATATAGARFSTTARIPASTPWCRR